MKWHPIKILNYNIRTLNVPPINCYNGIKDKSELVDVLIKGEKDYIEIESETLPYGNEFYNLPYEKKYLLYNEYSVDKLLTLLKQINIYDHRVYKNRKNKEELVEILIQAEKSN